MKFFATVLLASAVLSAGCSKKGEVCGKDNVTYDNECDLKDAKVKLASCVDCKSAKKLKSPKGGVCPTIDAPVCGNDGVTYNNECFMNVAKAKLDSCGACKAKNPKK